MSSKRAGRRSKDGAIVDRLTADMAPLSEPTELSPPLRRRPSTRWSAVRSAVVLIATAAGFAVSFVLLAQVIGRDSPWLGLLLMFYFLGLAKVAEPLVLLRLPAAMRALHPWERDGTISRKLAVSAFGSMLRDTPLRYLNASVYIAAASRDLAQLYRQVESGEAAHVYAAALFTPYIAYVAWRGHYREAAIFLLVQIVFNVYPVLHLRSVRGRLERPLQRFCRQAKARVAAA